MMESMRNAAKSWVAKVLIGLLAVSFGVWGIADVFTGCTTRRAGHRRQAGNLAPSSSASAFQNRICRIISRQTGQGLTPKRRARSASTRRCSNNLLQTAALDNEARS